MGMLLILIQKKKKTATSQNDQPCVLTPFENNKTCLWFCANGFV